jgi:hypothetical protein
MRRTKRHFLQMTAASVLVLIAPIAPAQAQLQWLEPFLEAIGGISGALGIADVLTKWYSTFAPDKRCKVDLGDLANIKLDCEVLSQTLDDETIPLLKNFVINKDSRSWKRVKVSVAQMLADSEVLIGNINRVIIILDEKTYPGPREDIQRLYRGVDSVRATMVVLARLPDSPEPEDFNQADKVLGAVFPLPELARNAATRLQIAVDDRQKLNCQ